MRYTASHGVYRSPGVTPVGRNADIDIRSPEQGRAFNGGGMWPVLQFGRWNFLRAAVVRGMKRHLDIPGAPPSVPVTAHPHDDV